MARQLTLAQEAEQAAASIGIANPHRIEELREELARVEAGGSLPPMIRATSRTRYLVRLRATIEAGEKQIAERQPAERAATVELVREILRGAADAGQHDAYRKAAVATFGEDVVRQAEQV